MVKYNIIDEDEIIKKIGKCKHCGSSDIAMIQIESNMFNFYCFTCGLNYEFTEDDI